MRTLFLDARGDPVTLRPLTNPTARTRRMRVRLRLALAGSRGCMPALLGGVFGAVFLVATLPLLSLLPGSMFVVGLLGLYVLLVFLMFFVLGRVADRMSLDRVVDAALAQRVCLACGYPLETIAPDERAHTVCPECGCAWRLPT